MRPASVTVVIPTHNRAHLLRRSIRSAQAQTHPPVEIVVVDDGSTDDSETVVNNILDPRIRYIRLAEKSNGAVARNTGILYGSGEYVALLDSDDEWLPEHLERKLCILQNSAAHGAFGSYYLAWNAATVEFRSRPRPSGMPMAEYILSAYPGNTHTSTLVLARAAMLAVMFDPGLEKHQDWDFAIRFSERFALVCDEVSTVLVHPEASGRMSFRMKHAATREFMRRYQHHLTEPTLARAYALFAKRTFESEGRTSHFREYLARALRHWPAAGGRDKVVIAALAVPLLDRMVVGAGNGAVRLQRRFRHAEPPARGPRLADDAVSVRR